MPLRTVAELKIERLEILAEDGSCDEALAPRLPDKLLRRMLELMGRIRALDERAVLLQRSGRLGTYPMITGQEAAQCVPPLALGPKDWVVPTYRGGGVYLARGVRPRDMLLYWAGDDRGARFPKGQNDLLFSIPVGTHLTQVSGLAWAEKIKKSGAVALTYCGDGTSSKGDLHEALTFAGQFKLPAIFIIENNGWAISVPRRRQAASRTLAQKAWGYGVFGLQADGNDALAVYKAVSDAAARARAGEGPSLLELETYRMGHHTTADDSSRYRDPAEAAAWKARDPILRLRRRLERLGLWDARRQAAFEAETAAWLNAEVAAYEAAPPPNPLDMFAHNYASAPWPLVEQRASLQELLDFKGGAEALEALPPAEGRFP